MEESPRVGVYVCHCGGNISDVVEVAEVAEAAGKLPGVVCSRTNMFMCSDPGQQLIVDDIQKEGLNRVVVASCSPRLHETTFRGAAARGGLNPFLYEHANIREQVSWCTPSRPAATVKATNLVAAAVAKAKLLEALRPIRVEVHRRAVVVGGGVSGLRAARDLAARGLPVTLVEQGPSLGGHMAELGRVYPTGEDAKDLLLGLVRKVASDPNITVLTDAQVVSAEGYIGNFTLRVRQLSPASERELEAGVVVMATGFDYYQPARGEFGYGDMQEVATLPELVRLLADQEAAGGGELRWRGRTVRNVAMIHCVGSRQIEGIHEPREGEALNQGCSRVCCTTTLQAANEIRDRFPQVNVFDFYRDIRTYGRGHEAYYEDASKKRVLFFRYSAEEPPVVERAEDGSAHPVVVRVRDGLTFHEEVEVPVDLVVLAVGMVPHRVDDLVSMLKLPVGSDGFLLEVHPKLRPVEAAVSGVMLAGSCQGPKDITESAASASAAAVKAVTILARGQVDLDPFVAEVIAERCDGCGACLPACGYEGVISLSGGVARINPALCKGCGACAAACPTGAIRLKGWTLDQYDAMVDALCAVNLPAEVAP